MTDRGMPHIFVQNTPGARLAHRPAYSTYYHKLLWSQLLLSMVAFPQTGLPCLPNTHPRSDNSLRSNEKCVCAPKLMFQQKNNFSPISRVFKSISNLNVDLGPRKDEVEEAKA